MTESDAPQPETNPESMAVPTGPRRSRRWRRRLLWAGAILLVLGLVLRVALVLLVPTILSSVAKGYNLDCRYGKLDLSVLGAEVGIWDLVVTPEEGGEPFLEAEYCGLDVSVWSLLRGKLVVPRAEVDGVDLFLDRAEDGSIPLLQRFAREAAEQSQEVEPVGGAPETEAEPMDLSLPLQVDALRAQLVHVTVRDRTVTPPVEFRADFNVRVSHLGSPTRPTRILVTAYSGAIVDTVQLEGRVRGTGNDLEAEGTVIVRGLHLAPLASQLGRLGLRPEAGSLSLSAQGRIVTKDSAVCPGAVAGSVVLEGLRATADGQEYLALDRLEVGVRSIDFRLADLEGVTIQGGRIAVERLEDGALKVGGIALVPSTAPTVPTAVEAPSGPGLQPGAPSTPAVYRVKSGLITLRDLALTFGDQATTPPAALAVGVESVLVTGLDRNPERLDTPCQIDVIASAPGIAEAVTLTTTLAPFAPRKTFQSAVRVGGITAAAAAPYLRAAGLQPALDDGSLSVDLEGEVTLGEEAGIAAELALRDVRYGDGDEELAGLDALEIRGLRLAGDGRGVAIASIDIAGPRARLHRDAAGNIELFGLRLPVDAAGASPDATSAPKAPETTPERPPEPAPRAEPPSSEGRGLAIDLGRVAVTGGALRFRDDRLEPSQETAIVDAALEVTGLVLPGETDEPEGSGKADDAATIRGSFRADGVLRQASVEGTLLLGGAGGTADLLAKADGITLAALAPYLEPIGVRPTLQDGAAELRLQGSWEPSGGSPKLDASISAVHFHDGDSELAGIDTFAVEGLLAGPEGVVVDALRVESPRLSLLRDEEGHLRVLGLRVGPAPRKVPEEAAEEEAPSSPKEETTPGAPPAPLPRIALKRLELKGASVAFRDSAVETGFETSIDVEAGLSDLVVAPDAAPAPFELRCRIPGCVEELSVDGEIVPRVEDARWSFLVQATGLRNAALKPYFPPTLQPVLEDGRFQARVELRAGRHADGGYLAGVSVDGLQYRDEAAAKDLLAVDAVRLLSRRVDPAAGVIALEEISVRGVRAEAWRLDAGRLRFLGFVASPASAETPSPETSSPDVIEPADAASTEPAAPRPEGTRGPGRRPEKVMDLELAKLDLHLERFALVDETRASAAPIVASDIRLESVEPIRLLGPSPEELPPVRLALQGALQPFVETVKVDVEARPFAAEPHLLATFDGAGIRGAGLTEAFPDLASILDGSELKDGRAHAQLETTLTIRRRGAAGFDLSHGIGGTVLLTDVAFRDGPDGDVLAGVDAVELAGIQIQPDTGAVRASALEVTTPRLRVVRDEDGIRVLDVLVRMPSSPSPESEEASPEAVAEAAPQAAEPPATSTEKPTVEKPAPEIAVGRISVNGLDVRVEDRSVTPPCLIPLTDLSLDIRGVSTRVLVEERPLRCSISVSAGKVPLSRTPAQGMLGGALTDTVDIVTTGTVEATEGADLRELFQEATLDARLQLYPQARGKVKATVSAFELEGLKGIAAASGIQLTAGIFDSVLEVELTKAGTLDLDSTAVFTNLNVTEPPDGPIFRYLHLPAPLQPVVFALRNENGELRIPLSVSVAGTSPSMGDVTGAALSTLSQLIGNAFLRSPLRMGKSVVGLVGFGGDEEPREEEPFVLPFSPAASVPTGAALEALAPLIERLEDGESLSITLSHRLGTSDVEHLGVLANPSPEECLELLASLERRQRELSQERAVLARTVVHTLGAGLETEARRARLRAQEVETEMGLLESAFDRLYELLRPGSDRYASKRLRRACIELGQTRLAESRNALLQWAPPGTEERVRVERARVQISDEETGAVIVEITRRKAD